MHSLNNELVKAGYDFAAAISNDTPIIEIAKIVSRLATQLDVTTLALREKSREVTAYEATVTNLSAQVQGLAAENADLKHPGTYLPSKRETPITDAVMAEIRAQGVEMFVSALQKHVDEGDFIGNEIAVITGAIDAGGEFAEKLRKEQGK